MRLAADLDRKFGLLGVVQARLPESDGLPSNAQPVTGTTRWVFETGALDEDAVIDDERAQMTSTRLTLELRHRTAPLTSPSGVWTSSVLGAPNPAVDELGDTPPPTLQGEPIEALRAGTSDA